MSNVLFQLIALNPQSIERYEDWLKIITFLGQSHGNFIARLPKKWLSVLIEKLMDIIQKLYPLKLLKITS